jgi:hypothetical protein
MLDLLIPILSVLVNLTVQVLSFRHWRGSNYFLTIILGFGVGLVAFVVMEIPFLWRSFSTDHLLTALLVNAPIYVCLAYCYYSFVQLGQTSIRIRLYAEIASKPYGLSAEEVAREYSDDSLVAVRIQRLVESGDLIKRNRVFFVGRGRLPLIGNILFSAKRFLLGKTSEFDEANG